MATKEVIQRPDLCKTWKEYQDGLTKLSYSSKPASVLTVFELYSVSCLAAAIVASEDPASKSSSSASAAFGETSSMVCPVNSIASSRYLAATGNIIRESLSVDCSTHQDHLQVWPANHQSSQNNQQEVSVDASLMNFVNDQMRDLIETFSGLQHTKHDTNSRVHKAGLRCSHRFQTNGVANERTSNFARSAKRQFMLKNEGRHLGTFTTSSLTTKDCDLILLHGIKRDVSELEHGKIRSRYKHLLICSLLSFVTNRCGDAAHSLITVSEASSDIVALLLTSINKLLPEVSERRSVSGQAILVMVTAVLRSLEATLTSGVNEPSIMSWSFDH
ncbi:hypothetical protein KCU85_g274, partial [Aureobasidium melanogenum]